MPCKVRLNYLVSAVGPSDGVVDTDVDFKSDGAVSSPTYYLLFSLFSFLKF